MGIIFLALVAGTSSGTFDSFGRSLNFLHAPENLGSVAAAHVELGRLDQAHGRDATAVQHFAKAAEAKNNTGKWLYAEALKAGRGTQADPAKAEALFAELAADKFDAAALKPAQPIARRFKEAPETPAETVAWLQTKADAGSDDAILALGVAHLTGNGVTKNEVEARRLFERATERNHPAAYYNLAYMALNGLGGAKDEAVAARRFKACIKEEAIPVWIKIICAVTMCAGTAAGGWRIIKTLGHKMVKLHPVHGFAAEATGASVLLAAASLGMPVSTTHAITTSIMGVGCAKGFNHLKFKVVERILWAWVLTIPASGCVAYCLVRAARSFGWLS
jgi:TPR repeat protein